MFAFVLVLISMHFATSFYMNNDDNDEMKLLMEGLTKRSLYKPRPGREIDGPPRLGRSIYFPVSDQATDHIDERELDEMTKNIQNGFLHSLKKEMENFYNTEKSVSGWPHPRLGKNWFKKYRTEDKRTEQNGFLHGIKKGIEELKRLVAPPRLGRDMLETDGQDLVSSQDHLESSHEYEKKTICGNDSVCEEIAALLTDLYKERNDKQ